MKTLKKTVCLLLCLMLVVLSASACKITEGQDEATGGETSRTDDATHSSGEPTTEQTTDPIKPTEDIFPISALKETKIVYRTGASEAVTGYADQLAKTIESVFSVKPAVGNDFLREGSDTFREYDYEILLGKTNRDAGAELLASVREQDYGYTIYGNKILVWGGNEQALGKAVSDFTYEVVTMKKGGGEVFYRTAFNASYPAEYAVEKLSFNGTSVREYRVVYPAAGTMAEQLLAERLSVAIRERTGITPGVVADSEQTAGAHEILIGQTNRTPSVELPTGAMHGEIRKTDTGLLLVGSDTTALAEAVEVLLKKIDAVIDPETRQADLTVTETLNATPGSSFSVMSFNVKTADMTAERKSGVRSMILSYLPDLLGIQEANPTWMTLLTDIYSPYYHILGEGRNGESAGEHTPIFFAKDRFELLESGTKWLSDTPDEPSQMQGANYYRIFTYAKLRDRVTDETFLYLNTHLDTAGDELRVKELNVIFEFLRSYSNLPLILTGDLNASVTSGAIRTLKAAGLTSLSDMTEQKNALPSIDWIFTTADCVSAESFRLCNEKIDGAYPSDHYPVFGRLTLSVPEGGVSYDWGEIPPIFPDGFAEVKKDTEGEAFGPIHKIP